MHANPVVGGLAYEVAMKAFIEKAYRLLEGYAAVLNTAVVGWFIEDRNSANYVDGATMQVDWVRGYKR